MEKEVGNMLHLVLPNGSNICSYYKKIKYFLKLFTKNSSPPGVTSPISISQKQHIFPLSHFSSMFIA